MYMRPGPYLPEHLLPLLANFLPLERPQLLCSYLDKILPDVVGSKQLKFYQNKLLPCAYEFCTSFLLSSDEPLDFMAKSWRWYNAEKREVMRWRDFIRSLVNFKPVYHEQRIENKGEAIVFLRRD